MQFITYLKDGQIQPARLHGNIGIDINQALLHDGFLEKKPILSSLPDLFINDEVYAQVRNSTEKIIARIKLEAGVLFDEGIIFNYPDAKILAPIPMPGKVICIAGNFPAPNKMEKPDFPIVFLKPSSGINGDREPVVIPGNATSVAYEVELALVMAKTGRNLNPSNALSIVAGVTLANDIGDRVLEKRTSQWTSGKMFDTFTPMGPVLFTLDELQGKKLAMATRVNDVIVQKGNVADMFFDLAALVSIVSELTTLRPGDVILTGSPKLLDGESAPVVALQPGDTVEVSIEGLGKLTNHVISEG